MPIVPHKARKVCLVCGKPSPRTICDVCARRLKSEALRNEIQDEKEGKRHFSFPE
jgi:predicted amidophosphoribosyltransferase